MIVPEHLADKLKKPTPQNWTAKIIAWTVVGSAVVGLIGGLVFLSALVDAYVVSTIWEWYIVKHFNMSPLPLSIAFGMCLLINYMIKRPSTKSDNDEPVYQTVLTVILTPLLALLFGWIGTFFL